VRLARSFLRVAAVVLDRAGVAESTRDGALTSERFCTQRVPGAKPRGRQRRRKFFPARIGGPSDAEPGRSGELRLDERSENFFERQLILPAGANTVQVKATLADGVLTVLTPKVPDVKDLTDLAVRILAWRFSAR
jgi:hypothetical protein